MKIKMEDRESNLDLMRLVCMLMVVTLHYFGEGGLNSSASTSTFNALVGSIMVVVCRGAVNCFYINSGYFFKATVDIINSWKSTFELYKQILFYSIVVCVVSVLLGISKLTMGAVVRAFFPILGNQWWFATVFLLISLLRPFLQKMVCGLRDKEVIFLLFFLMYFDAVQAVFGVNIFNESGNGLLHAITMVIFGYTIRRFNHLQLSQLKASIVYCGSVLFARASPLLMRCFPNLPIDYWNHIMAYNSPFIILMSWGVFCFFRGMKYRSLLISKISTSIFAAYLIQDHSMMREGLWKKMFHCEVFYDSNWMIVHCIISVLCITIVCITIDQIRLNIVKKIRVHKVKDKN